MDAIAGVSSAGNAPMVVAMIYLDHHATTPCDPRVVAAMLPYFSEHFGNPSGRTHVLGKRAYEATEAARIEVAAIVSGDADSADPREITFTSGATESVSLAIKGLAAAYPERPRRLVVAAFEHKAVLDTARSLERAGMQLVLVAPDAAGFVTPEAVRAAIGDGALMVCVMAAQNEVGTLQPLAAIGDVARAAGAFFFVDASQAVGKVPVDLRAVGADIAAFTAHKLYGPKGVGALWLRRSRSGEDVRLVPQVEGGGQERGLRAGTLNVPGIVGFGEAARIARSELVSESARLTTLRARLLAGLRERLGAGRVSGAADDVSDGPEPRLPGNLHVSFPGVEGAKLLQSLHDVAVSSGSACSSQKLEGSHVLRAMGLPDSRIFSAVRFGLGRNTTEAEVDLAAARVAEEVSRLRRGA